MIITVTVATAAARLVVTKILPALTIASPSILTVEAPLNPNQQNQRINTPKAPTVRLCPGIAFDLPPFVYLPIRGPRMMAPIRAATPPTICTAQEPAKSWNPIWLINPPPQIQCPDTGYTTRLIIRL